MALSTGIAEETGDRLFVAKLPRNVERPSFHGYKEKKIEQDGWHYAIVRAKPAYDGGMYEFVDPLEDKVVGCCGVHRINDFAWDLDAFEEMLAKRRLRYGR